LLDVLQLVDHKNSYLRTFNKILIGYCLLDFVCLHPAASAGNNLTGYIKRLKTILVKSFKWDDVSMFA